MTSSLGSRIRLTQGGFSLTELLMVLAISSILLGLSATAVRHFWQVRSLDGGAEQIQTQMREVQQTVVSESFPLVLGVRFVPGSPEWSLVRYQPAGDTCTRDAARSLDAGVVILDAAFASSGAPTTRCAATFGGSGDDYAFFFARGNATDGSVTLTHPGLGRQTTLTVNALTGRVDRVTP